jgi:hypothetical protein
LIFSYNKNKVPIDDETVGYQQYATPMADIPENKELVIYEVNLRAFISGVGFGRSSK